MLLGCYIRRVTKDTSSIPLSKVSFQGYIPTPRSSERAYFLSLLHFFEAEKFRQSHPDLYLEVLNCPSFRELAKLSRRNQSKWREDWLGIRGRVMICGMRYAQWSDLTPERWVDDETKLILELCELGFPKKFSMAAAAEFKKLATNPTWCFFGVDAAPPDVIGKRVMALHRRHARSWTVNHWLGRHTSWRMHDWALANYIPMRYYGSPGERLTLDAVSRLVTDSTNSCVFEQRGGKSMDSVIRHIKGMKAPLDMEFYS